MCKDAGKVSAFFSRGLAGSGKILEIIEGDFLVFKTGMVKSVKTGYLRKANLNVVFI